MVDVEKLIELTLFLDDLIIIGRMSPSSSRRTYMTEAAGKAHTHVVFQVDVCGNLVSVAFKINSRTADLVDFQIVGDDWKIMGRFNPDDLVLENAEAVDRVRVLVAMLLD